MLNICMVAHCVLCLVWRAFVFISSLRLVFSLSLFLFFVCLSHVFARDVRACVSRASLTTMSPDPSLRRSVRACTAVPQVPKPEKNQTLLFSATVPAWGEHARGVIGQLARQLPSRDERDSLPSGHPEQAMLTCGN